MTLLYFEDEASLVLITSHQPVVCRKLLMNVTASTLHIIIVHHEETQLASLVSTLHQSWSTTGLVALENILNHWPGLLVVRGCYLTLVTLEGLPQYHSDSKSQTETQTHHTPTCFYIK